MEMMYPSAIIISLILSLAIFFIKLKGKTQYTNGKRVANTKYIKETDYYKTKVKRYKIMSKAVLAVSIIVIMIGSILIARIVTIQFKNDEKNNRDIFLCIDTSSSQDKVNLDLAQKFKSIIPSLKGDRIGIVIFNSSPLLFCPLTEDYEYVSDCLDIIERQMKMEQNAGNYSSYSDEEKEEYNSFWFGGTNANSNIKGYSVIGDGLAGTIFSFPDLKKDTSRTRIIMFFTDNDLSGTEDVTLKEACELCKKYSIILYAHCPTSAMNKYVNSQKTAQYRSAVESAGGKFYNGSLDEISKMVDEIKKTKTTPMMTAKNTIIEDYPEVPFISMVIASLFLIILEKRVKL